MGFFRRSDHAISISSDTIIRAIVYTILAVLVLEFASQVTHQIRLILVSAFLAMALNPAVSWFTKRLKLKSRIKAAGIAYVAVISILIGFLVLIVPPLVNQSSQFIENVPQTVREFQAQDTALAEFVRENDLDGRLNQAASDFSNQFGGGDVLNTASRVGGTLVSIITVLVLTFMMLVEGPGTIDKLFHYTDPKQQKRRRNLLQKMYGVVTGYVNGQVLIAAIAASFALIALLIASSIVGANVNVVAMAAIVFIFGLIPLIGNILAASLVVLFSLFASTTLALIMAVFFIVYQQVENASLQPYIQARSNQLTPLTVFVAAIVGAGFGGLLGALAAIPVAGCIRVWILDRYPDPSETKEA
ncbi:MAG: AI-2E family transporter [Candidatus Saccharibacteria bacterium]|nr:AI-2E family transporter [Candidatus Saccharibacteria bacterium]